jgi:hypothetical protein
MREYRDRYIRDDTHLRAVVAYIHDNPVKAGLCTTPASWPWSSAKRLPPPHGNAEPRLGTV